MLLQNRQLLQYFGLNHRYAVLLDHGSVFGLLNHIAEDCQNDARHLVLDGIVQDVTQNRNDLVPA